MLSEKKDDFNTQHSVKKINEDLNKICFKDTDEMADLFDHLNMTKNLEYSEEEGSHWQRVISQHETT